MRDIRDLRDGDRFTISRGSFPLGGFYKVKEGMRGSQQMMAEGPHSGSPVDKGKRSSPGTVSIVSPDGVAAEAPLERI